MKRQLVWALGLALATSIATPGCVVRGQGSVGVEATGPDIVYDAPPPPRIEQHPARAGFVWISGRWDWRSGQWAWVDGHWERARANQSWIVGRWELRGGRYVWIAGLWGAGAPAPRGPVVRDHRH
jgi:hypothetical protein